MAPRGHEAVDDPANLVVPQDRVVLRQPEFPVQEGVPVQDAGLHARGVRPGESPGVGELESCQQVTGCAELLAVFLKQFGMQRAQGVLG